MKKDNPLAGGPTSHILPGAAALFYLFFTVTAPLFYLFSTVVLPLLHRCFHNTSPDKQRRQSAVTTLYRRHDPLAATHPTPRATTISRRKLPVAVPPLRQG
ncbi:hypothetical protein E4Q23_21540 [Candidatus Accumulibacter phosphatis]|uniref:Uncharacterized protein n=1 Tax=Candidatus Accumulibacter phosphatis TaxID=327160 RepID=A0ABX1U5L1_9PROT|nr:hypothetical protein [Candidatus Accumulibacter phosphatis]NMQ30108.1 hypothetical protein [Candidatus Accumulibacter phosphatis]